MYSGESRCAPAKISARRRKSMCGGESLAFLKLSPTPREFQTRKISPFRFRPGFKENGQNYPGKILSKPVKSAGERDRKALKNAFCRAYSLCACLPERIARISWSEILLAPGGFDEKREFPCLRPAGTAHGVVHGPCMGSRMVSRADSYEPGDRFFKTHCEKSVGIRFDGAV